MSPFRDGIRALGFDYAVDVITPRASSSCATPDLRKYTRSVGTVAEVIGDRSYRKVTWRQGSRRALSARFATLGCAPSLATTGAARSSGSSSTKSIATPPWTTMCSRLCPRPALASSLSVESNSAGAPNACMKNLKGELGLDHFEGRTYPGWQHHVSCVLACYAFLIAERTRAFPPEAGRTSAHDTNNRPARTTLRRFDHHIPACGCQSPGLVAASMSVLPTPS